MKSTNHPILVPFGAFSHKYVVIAAFFGFVTSIGQNFQIPKFSTLLFILVFLICAFLAVREGLDFKRRGILTVVAFSCFGLLAGFSSLRLGILDITLIIHYGRVVLFPCACFVCFYIMKEKAIPVLIAFLLANGALNLLLNGYIFATNAVISSAGIDRTVISPFTGEELRATGASRSIIGLCLAGFFVYQVKGYFLRLSLVVLCLLGFLFSVYIGSRGMILSVFPFLFLYFLWNSLSSSKAFLSLLLAFVVGGVILGIAISFEPVRYVLFERVLTRFTQENLLDITFSGRTFFWQYGLEQALADPHGKGFVYLDATTGLSSHNTFLELWISYGILAMVSFVMIQVVFLVICTSSAIKRWKGDRVNLGIELFLFSVLLYYLVEAHIYTSFGLLAFSCCFMGILARGLDYPILPRARTLHPGHNTIRNFSR